MSIYLYWQNEFFICYSVQTRNVLQLYAGMLSKRNKLSKFYKKMLSCIWWVSKELGRSWCVYWGKGKCLYKHMDMLATAWSSNSCHQCTCQLSLELSQRLEGEETLKYYCVCRPACGIENNNHERTQNFRFRPENPIWANLVKKKYQNCRCKLRFGTYSSIIFWDFPMF